ncbi:MAG: UDP-N-acetylglucosamine--N-acetylmuramyl-(pentapeptide) pyrophosphoryl-undecaprenol N-acetylglucosamine transferase [Candidatus Pacebacteria bacterium]|nr:UDP-N-acetylglucosamine--N-acetylmuramyl-(pentapeptide) pyrophosphoryl-undecaprenol N-acetylglucosamine transferase [Candidatus Paceibacterota bacterium]
MSKRILLVGGGSGGHVFPLMAVAEALHSLDPSAELMVLGDGPFIDTAIAASGLPHKKIIAGKFRRYFSFWNFLSPFQMLVGFFQSLWFLFWYMPDIVFTKGGYTSVMPALVAKLYMIPLYTHESDAVPGMANKLISKLAKNIFTSFDSTASFFKVGKAVLVGNPVRPEVLSGDKSAALTQFNLKSDKKIILVVGGSQGSKRINDAILEAIVPLVENFQVVHQCGDSQMASVEAVIDQYTKEGEKSYGSLISANYRLYPFMNPIDMGMAYAAADVIISRGGASNLFEIASLGKPAVIIPLTKASSRGDQIDNAIQFEKYGAVVIEEANITPHIIVNQIKELLEPARYSEVAAKIKTFAKPHAAKSIAQVLLS